MALLSAPVPFASAQPCPDVEAVFARGSGEPPGVGGVGQAFVDPLRSQVGSRSLGVYPVNDPASTDFNSPIGFPEPLSTGSGTRALTRVDGRELPEHQDGARRIFPRRGRDGFHHRGCGTAGGAC